MSEPAARHNFLSSAGLKQTSDTAGKAIPREAAQITCTQGSVLQALKRLAVLFMGYNPVPFPFTPSVGIISGGIISIAKSWRIRMLDQRVGWKQGRRPT